MENKSNKVPVILLFVMSLLMLGSVWNDSGTFDEVAHIPAGYTYLTQLDYRLNPEHPPLVKVLSALGSWIFAHPNFPTDIAAWNEEINGQWTAGNTFLYETGNDADAVLFWSRIPVFLLSLLTGGILFLWVRRRFNPKIATLTLFFFVFSPTVLTHSRFVTTDIGATLGFFLGISSFIAFLEYPSWKRTILVGLALGLGQLIKFSLVMLIPIYGILLIAWVLTRPNYHLHERVRLLAHLAIKLIPAGATAFILIWGVYTLFTWNYPPDRQYRDTEAILSTNSFSPGVNLDLFLTKNKLTRPLGEYVLGVLMANQRRAGGNTTYFMNEVSSKGWHSFFPLIYLFKEPLSLHILALIALWFAIKKTIRSSQENYMGLYGRLRNWIEMHFTEFSALVFIVFYWGVSIASPLNIGIRHVLPTFPFIYLLIARHITEWLKWHEASNPQTWGGWLHNLYQLYVKAIPKYLFTILLLLWMMLGTISIYPHFMTYYNELVGARYGYTIAVDSNYDWGQDLKRLTKYVEENKIEKISLDYFGGSSPKYYLGNKFEPWWSARGPVSGWFAVSATVRQGAWGKIGAGFYRKHEDSYEWLKPYEPVAKIGYSIFIYRLP